MKKIILPILISAMFVANLVNSQGVCGTYDGYLQDEMKKYPEFYKSIEVKNIELEKKSKELTQNLSEKESVGEKKIIPVVVHVIHDFGSANITDADVNYALEQLNKNINRQADNMLTTPDVFAAVSGSANVEFRLATIDPTGNPTNGIVRIQSELTNVPESRDIVKSLSYWNSYQYFNIWVVNSLPSTSDGNTLLGYAQFPWSGSMSTDGVAIISSHFKTGKTLTHEVGHWLGLRHIWGDGLCGDDNVYDTPVAKEENWGVTINQFPYNLNVCIVDTINPAGEMFMNYMDYSDDNVMSLFTDGQMEIVNQTLVGDAENYPFRRYLWSAENLEKTGAANGTEGEACNKNANFKENYGNVTNCVGDLTVLNGNKNIFTNITDLTWDWGDGSSTSTTNNPQHYYTVAGTYDVSMSIEYTDDVVAKSYSMDDVESGYTNLETITDVLMIEGTMEELNAVNATNITLHLDDSSYHITLDTLFFRGDYEETYYLAHYETSCISNITKEGFITILSTVSSNTNDLYTYSFEGSTLEEDFLVVENDLVSDWDFGVSANPNWEVVEGVGSEGNSSIMMDGKKLTSANSIIFETESYNLSDLSNPAIAIDFIGAAVNSFPKNTLLVSYSTECGVWKELATISPSDLASAGYYSQNFIPTEGMIWNDTVMFDQIGVNNLKSNNVRFRFEYTVTSLANRLYIDNIRVGEASNLMTTPNPSSQFALSIYPNPTTDHTQILFNSSNNGLITIKMYDILGAEVLTLFNNSVEEGHNSFNINLENIEEGLYFISMISEGQVVETTKILVQ